MRDVPTTMRISLILRIAGAILASTTGVGGLRAHDLLVNGSFTTDLSGWTLPANGATWSNGQLSLYAPAGESRTVAQCVAVSGRGRVQASYRASWFFGFPGHFGYGLSGAV